MSYNICVSIHGYSVRIEDGRFEPQAKIVGHRCSIRSRNIMEYVRMHLPSYIRCSSKINMSELRNYLNTKIEFKCKFGIKNVRIGQLHMLFNLPEPIINKEYLDWVVYFDVKYENAYAQYELTRLFKTQDFLRELIGYQFAPKKEIENTESLKRIVVYTNHYEADILYADSCGLVTKTKKVNSTYSLHFRQAPRGYEAIEKMISKIPKIRIDDIVQLDKLESTNFLIDWYIKNGNKPEYKVYSKLISETLIDCDLETIKKFISGL